MKIGIDIDDTLTNTKEAQLKYWEQYYLNNPQKGYTKKIPKTINDFGDDYVQLFWDTYRQELSFETTFKKDVSKILHELINEGHSLCIITSRPDKKYNDLHKQLKEWFSKNDIPIFEIYTNIRDKGEFCKNNKIDLFIDDDIKHIEKANNYNIKTILFNKNKNYKGLQTTSWKKIKSIIKSTN